MTYAQDKRTSRALLQLARLPSVPGATFSFRGIDDALVYAARIGYPVQIQMAIADDARHQMVQVDGPDEFTRAIADLRRVPSDDQPSATSLTRSAYSLTGLIDHEVGEDGQPLLGISTRYLVRKGLGGQLVRASIVDDRFVGATLIDGDAVRDVSPFLHTTLKKRARLAAKAIPGLAMATVDLLAKDHTTPAQEQEWCVVNVSERPLLDSFSRTGSRLSQQIAHSIVTAESRKGGQGHSIDPREQVSATLHIDCAVAGDDLASTLTEAAREQGCQADLEVADAAEGRLEGRFNGSVGAVAWLLESAMAGLFGAPRPLKLMAMNHQSAERDAPTQHR